MTSGANVIPGPHIQMSVGKVGTRKKVCSNTSDDEFSSDFLSLFFLYFFFSLTVSGVGREIRSRASQPGVLIRLALGRHPAADNEADSRGRRSPGHSGKKSRLSTGFSFSAELKPPHLSLSSD